MGPRIAPLSMRAPRWDRSKALALAWAVCADAVGAFGLPALPHKARACGTVERLKKWIENK
jgi:hypothetical protein